MAFQEVVGKIGNMRKAVEWVIYPNDGTKPTRLIQSDNRIAQVNLETGRVLLSDGKGGHQGFFKLSPGQGAKWYDCPQEMLDKIKSYASPGESVSVSDLLK